MRDMLAGPRATICAFRFVNLLRKVRTAVSLTHVLIAGLAATMLSGTAFANDYYRCGDGYCHDDQADVTRDLNLRQLENPGAGIGAVPPPGYWDRQDDRGGDYGPPPPDGPDDYGPPDGPSAYGPPDDCDEPNNYGPPDDEDSYGPPDDPDAPDAPDDSTPPSPNPYR